MIEHRAPSIVAETRGHVMLYLSVRVLHKAPVRLLLLTLVNSGAVFTTRMTDASAAASSLGVAHSMYAWHMHGLRLPNLVLACVLQRMASKRKWPMSTRPWQTCTTNN